MTQLEGGHRLLEGVKDCLEGGGIALPTQTGPTSAPVLEYPKYSDKFIRNEKSASRNLLGIEDMKSIDDLLAVVRVSAKLRHFCAQFFGKRREMDSRAPQQ